MIWKEMERVADFADVVAMRFHHDQGVPLQCRLAKHLPRETAASSQLCTTFTIQKHNLLRRAQVLHVWLTCVLGKYILSVHAGI